MRRIASGRSEGFSLIEILTAITILGLIAAPIGASLVLSFRLNARSRQLMQDQLAVSSVVEKLMAKGIDGTMDYTDRFSENGVSVEIVKDGDSAAYSVTVISGEVTAKTYIRPAKTPGMEGEAGSAEEGVGSG